MGKRREPVFGEDQIEHTETRCSACDAARRRNDWERHDLGKPCDICAGRGVDYIGRRCRHAEFV